MKRRELIADRLAASRRPEDAHVAPLERRLHHVPLPVTKGVEAEEFKQRLLKRLRLRGSDPRLEGVLWRWWQRWCVVALLVQRPCLYGSYLRQGRLVPLGLELHASARATREGGDTWQVVTSM